MPLFLTLSTIRYGSRVKWSNPKKGAAPSSTSRCSSYRKGSLQITLDYSRQLCFTYMLLTGIRNPPKMLSVRVCLLLLGIYSLTDALCHGWKEIFLIRIYIYHHGLVFFNLALSWVLLLVIPGPCLLRSLFQVLEKIFSYHLPIQPFCRVFFFFPIPISYTRNFCFLCILLFICYIFSSGFL